MLMLAIVGIPILFVVAGTLGALSFAQGFQPEAEAERPQPRKPVEIPAILETPVAPVPQPGHDVDEMLLALEAHMRRERQAAAKFAQDPSSQSLWLN